MLVVPGGWNRDARIGELSTTPEGFREYLAPELYGKDRLTGRPVEWLGQIIKNRLDPIIIDIVHKPNAFVLLPRDVRRKVYELSYPSYTLGDEFSARFDVKEERYRSLDDLIIQAFFNFVAANTKAVSEGHGNRVRGLTEAAFIDAGSFNMDLRTEINSPGFLNLSSLRITPLVAAALLVLTVEVGPDAVAAAENGTLRIGNSLSQADDQCVADVQEQAIRQLQLLGLDRWAVACEKARRATQNTGVKGPARVRN